MKKKIPLKKSSLVLAAKPRAACDGYLKVQKRSFCTIACDVSPQLHREFKYLVAEEGTSMQRKVHSMIKAYIMRKSHV